MQGEIGKLALHLHRWIMTITEADCCTRRRRGIPAKKIEKTYFLYDLELDLMIEHNLSSSLNTFRLKKKSSQKKKELRKRKEKMLTKLLLLLLTGGVYPGEMSMNRHLIFREAMRSTTLGHATGSFCVRLLSMSCQCIVCFNRKGSFISTVKTR